jgi:hypothetical protein
MVAVAAIPHPTLGGGTTSTPWAPDPHSGVA